MLSPFDVAEPIGILAFWSEWRHGDLPEDADRLVLCPYHTPLPHTHTHPLPYPPRKYQPLTLLLLPLPTPRCAIGALGRVHRRVWRLLPFWCGGLGVDFGDFGDTAW